MFGKTTKTLMLASLLVLSVGVAAAATVTTADFQTDDPANESIEVALDFAASTDATIQVTDGTTIYDQSTISGNSTASPFTETLSMGAAGPGDNLSLTVDSPDAANVTMSYSELVKTSEASVNMTNNETLIVDAGFEGSVNTTADVFVEDSTGTELLNDTLSYTAGEYDGSGVVTQEYNASDGLASGDLTVEVRYSNLTAYDSAFAQSSAETTTDDDTSGGAAIALDDTYGGFTVAQIGAGAIVLLGVLGYVYTRDDY